MKRRIQNEMQRIIKNENEVKEYVDYKVNRLREQLVILDNNYSYYRIKY